MEEHRVLVLVVLVVLVLVVPSRWPCAAISAACQRLSPLPSLPSAYCHGNPGPAFGSLQTTFALSSCMLALSRAEGIPAALNELKKKKKLNLDGRLLSGRPYSRKERATFK